MITIVPDVTDHRLNADFYFHYLRCITGALHLILTLGSNVYLLSRRQGSIWPQTFDADPRNPAELLVYFWLIAPESIVCLTTS